MNFSLVVTDSGPLITLAIASSLDVLFLPNLPVIDPHMVRHEAIQDLSKPGAGLVAAWIRLNDPLDFTRFNRHLLRSKLNWRVSHEESQIPS